MRGSFFHTLASFFALLCVLFIPLPFFLNPFQRDFTEFVFSEPIYFISSKLFGKDLPTPAIYSDSTSMYVLVLILFLIALLASFFIYRTAAWERSREKFLAFLYRLLFYYLAALLLKYGADKIFKNQFYLPEPNTLYTPVGDLSKDILYWTSMGTSHFYGVFMGILESLAAILLLIPRTRLAGLLASLVILVNVAAINFGFDIGVKLMSLWLLFIILYLLAPHARRLFDFFIGRSTHARLSYDQMPLFRKTLFISIFKWFIVLLIFLEVVYPFIKKGNFNDDLAKRPYLHGAYEVKEMRLDDDTLAPDQFLFKRIFVHRHGYLIFQDQEGRMDDYKMSYNPSDNRWIMLTDYQMKKILLYVIWHDESDILEMAYSSDEKYIQVRAKAIDWRDMPALQKGFHWTVD